MDSHVISLEKVKIVASSKISLFIKARFLLFHFVFSKENSTPKPDFKSLPKIE